MINLHGKCPPPLAKGFAHEQLGCGAGPDGRKRCIINVAIGGNYAVGQARLVESIREVGYNGSLMTWTECLPPGSPTEQAVPRGYKMYAFEHAQRMGYDLILWLDASLWCVRPVDRLFQWATDHGAYAFMFRELLKPGHLGEEALPYIGRFGATEDELRQIKLVLGGIWAVDLDNETGLELHNRMRRWVRTPLCFEADVNRDEGPLSIEMHRMSIKREDAPGAYQGFYVGPASTVGEEFVASNEKMVALHCGC